MSPRNQSAFQKLSFFIPFVSVPRCFSVSDE
jgi:hypothetical protein